MPLASYQDAVLVGNGVTRVFISELAQSYGSKTAICQPPSMQVVSELSTILFNSFNKI